MASAREKLVDLENRAAEYTSSLRGSRYCVTEALGGYPWAVIRIGTNMPWGSCLQALDKQE